MQRALTANGVLLLAGLGCGVSAFVMAAGPDSVEDTAAHKAGARRCARVYVKGFWPSPIEGHLQQQCSTYTSHTFRPMQQGPCSRPSAAALHPALS